MKKALAIILTVIMSVFALGGCQMYWERKAIFEITGISLPDRVDEKYKEGTGFKDRFDYYVFYSEDFSEDWLSENSFINGPNGEFEERFNKYCIENWSDKDMGLLSKEYTVKFDEAYYYSEPEMYGERSDTYSAAVVFPHKSILVIIYTTFRLT